MTSNILFTHTHLSQADVFTNTHRDIVLLFAPTVTLPYFSLVK